MRYACAFLLLLAACTSPEERAQQEAEREINACMQQGFTQGTQAFEDCRLAVRADEEKKAAARSDFDPQPLMTPGRPGPVMGW